MEILLVVSNTLSAGHSSEGEKTHKQTNKQSKVFKFYFKSWPNPLTSVLLLMLLSSAEGDLRHLEKE